MKNSNFIRLAVIIGVVAFLSACQKSDDFELQNQKSMSQEDFELKSGHKTKGHKTQGFVHGIVVEINGEDYYFADAPDGPNGEIDVPGHYWVKAGPKLVGKHYNTGPFGDEKWWSSDAPDGELFYVVDAIIDEWTEEKSKQYAAKGYVHYHEWGRVSDGELHPEKVVWLKHTARTSFTFDGGPHQDMFGTHEVTPGVDYEFMPNEHMPYWPDSEENNH